MVTSIASVFVGGSWGGFVAALRTLMPISAGLCLSMGALSSAGSLSSVCVVVTGGPWCKFATSRGA